MRGSRADLRFDSHTGEGHTGSVTLTLPIGDFSGEGNAPEREDASPRAWRVGVRRRGPRQRIPPLRRRADRHGPNHPTGTTEIPEGTYPLPWPRGRVHTFDAAVAMAHALGSAARTKWRNIQEPQVFDVRLVDRRATLLRVPLGRDLMLNMKPCPRRQDCRALGRTRSGALSRSPRRRLVAPVPQRGIRHAHRETPLAP